MNKNALAILAVLFTSIALADDFNSHTFSARQPSARSRPHQPNAVRARSSGVRVLRRPFHGARSVARSRRAGVARRQGRVDERRDGLPDELLELDLALLDLVSLS